MPRVPLAAAIVLLLVVTSGVVAEETPEETDGIVDVRVGDLVIGEDEQRIGPMRAAGFDEESDEVVVEIDLTTLESHGVDVGDAAVDLTDDSVVDASLESATVDDGVVRLVFSPDDEGFAVREFRITGLDTTNADAASGLEYDVAFSAGDGIAQSFDLVDPDDVTPTLSPRPFVLDRGEHAVTIEGIQPAQGDVTVELDVTALESHGVGLDGLDADASADGATVRETAVEDGVVTVVVSPDAALIDVRVEMSGFDASEIDADERFRAEGVAYEAAIEGADDGSVEVDAFDLVANTPTPSPHGETSAEPHDEPSAETHDAESPLTPWIPIAGIVLAGWGIARRSRRSRDR